MLTSLHIKNLALVDELEIAFESGLNVITGETGAGKSVIIGAVNLLVGERADKSLVREGADSCAISGVFKPCHLADIDAFLEANGVAPCEEDQLIVRRLLNTAGAGRQFVNDSPVTLQILKRLGDLLVDMHGPHDHQSLFRPEFQLGILDDYGELGIARAAFRKVYDQWLTLGQRRQTLEVAGQNLEREVDFLAFQIKELDEANLQVDEEESIIKEQTLLGNAHRILQLAGEVSHALTEADTSAFTGLVAARKSLESLIPLTEAAGDWKTETHELAMRIQDLSATITRHFQSLESDPGRLSWLDERLAVYQKMKRKYGGSVPEILQQLETARQRLADLTSRDERLKQLDLDIAAARRHVETAGTALRTERRKTAKRLETAVKKELTDLGFLQAEFSVTVELADVKASGLDAVEFLFAPNPGEAIKPLRAIASGGEMSRTLLAIKAVLADQDRIPVLIFDEIDANIGGKTGQAVGQKLADVARRHQILCITHLPQVAAYGAAHYAVSKTVLGQRTLTRIQRLTDEERVEEVARMLGGKDLTSVILDHACELLAKASQTTTIKTKPARSTTPAPRATGKGKIK